MSLFDTMKIRFIFIFFIIASVSACVKAPSYPVEPHIEFKSVSSSYVYSGYVDTISFSFTDGDGDIGVNSNGSDSTCDLCSLKHGDSSCLKLQAFNIFMIDSRDSCLNYFASATISSNSKFKGISGVIDVIRAVDSKSCLAVPNPSCPLDTVKFTIVLRDMAGHFSNLITTSPIVIDPH